MHYVINKLKSQIEKQKATLLDDEGSLSIESLLSSDKFQSIINNCRSFRSRFYTPFVTLILFIRQVLSPDKSCKNTVATFLASVSTEDNNNIPSSNTGPYCKARQKLPIETLKEIAVHFLAYNLIRTLIAEACRNTERLPIQVSFKGVIQLFNSFVSLLSFSADCNKAHAILLHAIIKNKVGNRPGRIEPRAVKKRPKAFRRLNKSRELEKAEITKRMKKNSNKKCSSAP
ncbi:hypothetical protein Psal073_01152 [Piscirickettsia salmonis]|uniref:hypothetical protein n=1 Tax=Piscirickettsia salmonis TaxID=1238 RepID=UPI0012B9AA00|nr:hypothetical protein [Piscirickettsia salmonis]QGO66204.1 hypothetical protein Psal073_01152 [Piscirickettsia salmonis]